MLFKIIKLGVFAAVLYLAFLSSGIKSECRRYRGAAINMPPKNYYNEADREENEVHHHFGYPESAAIQQQQTLIGEKPVY